MCQNCKYFFPNYLLQHLYPGFVKVLQTEIDTFDCSEGLCTIKSYLSHEPIFVKETVKCTKFFVCNYFEIDEKLRWMSKYICEFIEVSEDV